MRQFVIAAAFLISVAAPALAQIERYDTGRKLIAFENAWDAQSDAAARKRTLPHLKTALTNFFAGRFGEAAGHMDAARFALKSAEPFKPGPQDQFVLRPGSRFIDKNEPRLTLQWARLYGESLAVPTSTPAFHIEAKNGKPSPMKCEVALVDSSFNCRLANATEGDFRIVSAGAGEGQWQVGLSIAEDISGRLSRIAMAVTLLPERGLTTEQLTLKSHHRLLTTLARGAVGETDYPAHKLLVEAESLVKLPESSKYFDATKPGQYWLTLATEKGTAPVRLFVPEAAKKGQPLPLVVALHGMGGTENLFFDGLGHGEIVRQCEKRGWLLVATRTEGLISIPPVAAVVDELVKRYPVDQKKVFLVGHSMGAGQAISLARTHPDRWAGVVCLGGAGRVGDFEKIKNIPFFVGCGSEDFALNGARSLAKSLKDGGIEKVKYVEYPDIEHIVVVQVALPEVFRWYDELAK